MKKLDKQHDSTSLDNVESDNQYYYEYKFTDPSKYSTEEISSIINRYLREINKEEISTFVDICMGEIVSNSIKANLKRAHFILNGLNINNPKEYKIGMQNFHDEGLCMINDKETIKTIRRMNYYVKIDFYLSDNQFKIVTINNCGITPEEQERIYEKLRMGESSKADNGFAEVVDTTEGSGLGILMIIRLLNQMGLSRDCFSISTIENETITELSIPA